MFSNVLVVCVGNICRSPMAVALLRHRLADPEVRIQSAGIAALSGSAMDPLAKGHSNMNALVDTADVDATAGSAPLRSFPCDVRALKEPGGWNGWKPAEARCVSRPAEGVIEIALAAVDGVTLPGYLPGQYVRIALEVPGVPGVAGASGVSREERSYSLTGAVSAAGHSHYTVAVRHGAGGGGVSDVLHRYFAAQPQGVLRLEMQRPGGRFLLPLPSLPAGWSRRPGPWC